MSNYSGAEPYYLLGEDERSGRMPSVGYSLYRTVAHSTPQPNSSPHHSFQSRNPFLTPAHSRPATPPIDTNALFSKFKKNSSTSTRTNIRSPSDFKVECFSKENLLTSNGSNFIAWTTIQEVLLRGWGWLEHLDRSQIPSYLPDDLENWKAIDLQVITQLAMNMDYSLYGELSLEANTAADLWEALRNRFSRRSVLAQSNAEERLRQKHIQPNQTMGQHIEELRTLCANLLNVGGSINSGSWHAVIMRSLNGLEKWSTAKTLGAMHNDPELYIGMLLALDNADESTTRESALQA